ncbi:MAG: hypothetical protein OEZ59_09015 [Deltaproteobacteria bacterium]|nr:hypothetical protein [Deltaproteobacteria bacterium]
MDGRTSERVLRRFLPGAVLALALLVLVPGGVRGYELEQSLNMAGVASFPTAFDQPSTNIIHTSLELTDIKEPVIYLYNVRYGIQWRNLQVLGDVHYSLEPEHEFDHGQLRAKFRLLNLDEFRTYMALGALGRYVSEDEEAPWRIDDRPSSLFGVVTIELFPLEQWGGFLFNLYLDNRYFSGGVKIQAYPTIQIIGEMDYLHDTWQEDKFSGRAGVELDGDQNFYFQLLYTDVGAKWLANIGVGF